VASTVASTFRWKLFIRQWKLLIRLLDNPGQTTLLVNVQEGKRSNALSRNIARR